MTNKKVRQATKDAATEWFVRLRDDPVSDSDRAAFEAWRNADPAHADAYREMERLWRGLDQVDHQSSTARVIQDTRGAKGARRPAVRRYATKRLAFAASVAAIVGFSAYGLTPAGLFAEHRTQAGEQSEITLEDGSVLHLNTATAISTEFTADKRQITLHSGEAYFEVAKDISRPFVVDAEIGQVEVLGTAFSVKRRDNRLEVIVTENRVTVSGQEHRPAVAAAGQGVRITEAGLTFLAHTNTETSLAWRRGRLVFDNKPLGEVLAELDRYRKGRIVVLDSALKTLPVTGSFAIDQADKTLGTIEQTLPLRLLRLSDLLVVVYADPPP
ncbi:FecR family protein [Pelagibius sp.]|uniref:FecR family protein n=1 Tax=Pelagibius sp. TaxID=1931238 RepID=UPI003BAF41E7